VIGNVLPPHKGSAPLDVWCVSVLWCPHEFSDHVALCSAAFRLSSPVTASAVLSAWNETHLSAISARKIAYKHTFREMGKVLQVDAGRDWGPGQARKPSSGKQTPNWRGFESW